MRRKGDVRWLPSLMTSLDLSFPVHGLNTIFLSSFLRHTLMNKEHREEGKEGGKVEEEKEEEKVCFKAEEVEILMETHFLLH